MFCSKCGKEVDENDKFCGNCGTEIGKNTKKGETINTNNDSNLEDKFNKCKKIVKGSIIVGLVSFIMMLLTLHNIQTESIGYIMRTICFIAMGIYVISILGCAIIAKKRKKILKGWLGALEILTISIIIVVLFIWVINKKVDNDMKENMNRARQELNVKTPNQITQDNTSKTESVTNNNLVGKHNIVYIDGIDISNITGYLDLKNNNSFKMYVYYPYINMEITNIEGTYRILGDKIILNITKEGGYDLGSQKREETITIAQDNLAYSNMKFAK